MHIMFIVFVICVASLSAETDKCHYHYDKNSEIESMSNTIIESTGYSQHVYRCTKSGLWVEDKAASAKANDALVEMQIHQDKLVAALRSRVLTCAEMSEVERRGAIILVRPMQPFFQEEIDKRFNDLMLTQFKIRLAAGTQPCN